MVAFVVVFSELDFFKSLLSSGNADADIGIDAETGSLDDVLGVRVG